MIRYILLLSMFLGGFLEVAHTEEERFFAFSYFTGKGEDGLHLLVSRDALVWEETNGGKSYLPPIEGNLMRDPSICQGPDGTFHLAWTMRWKELRGIGYAASRDLIHWTEPQMIPLMEYEPTTRNVWAPEIFWDKESGYFYIIWASTISGRFSTEGTSETKYDHRQYFTRTRDWKAFDESKLFFDPGHNVIDAFLAKREGTYYLFYKDETLKPERKVICMATSNNLLGPWEIEGDVSPIAWVEGPSALYLNGKWLVCYDCYTKGRYGAIVSTDDGKTWSDISDKFHVPPGIRHGTMFPISREIYEKLRDYGK